MGKRLCKILSLAVIAVSIIITGLSSDFANSLMDALRETSESKNVADSLLIQLLSGGLNQIIATSILPFVLTAYLILALTLEHDCYRLTKWIAFVLIIVALALSILLTLLVFDMNSYNKVVGLLTPDAATIQASDLTLKICPVQHNATVNSGTPTQDNTDHAPGDSGTTTPSQNPPADAVEDIPAENSGVPLEECLKSYSSRYVTSLLAKGSAVVIVALVALSTFTVCSS